MNLRDFFQNFLAHKKRFRFAAARILVRSRLCRFITIDRGNYKIHFFPTNLSQELWINPHSRIDDEAFLSAYLKEDDIYLDVGANIGTLALQAASLVGSSGVVVAFEPHPAIYKYLTRNIEANQGLSVTAHNIALGDAPGLAFLTDFSADDQNRISANSGTPITVMRLDDVSEVRVLIKSREIGLLKVDVEGYEKMVLDGGHNVLSKTKVIMFESWALHFKKFGYSCSDVFDLLSSQGFALYKVIFSHDTDVPYLRSISSRHLSGDCENLLAIRNMVEFSNRTGFYVRDS